MYYYFLYIGLSVLVLPALFFGIYAQTKISSAYNTAKQISCKKGLTAKEFARRVLDAGGMSNIKIVEVKGELTDYYDSKNKTLALSQGNYNSSSLAALGIAAHEIGHAIQDKTGYKPLKIRHLFIKVSNFFSKALIPLMILSVLISFLLTFFFNTTWDFNTITYLPLYVVIGLYALSCILNLVTLFVEYNASARSRNLLVESGLLGEDEYGEVKKVLNAAALTYVASFVTSLFELLRLVLLLLLSRHRNND